LTLAPRFTFQRPNLARFGRRLFGLVTPAISYRQQPRSVGGLRSKSKISLRNKTPHITFPVAFGKWESEQMNLKLIWRGVKPGLRRDCGGSPVELARLRGGARGEQRAAHSSLQQGAGEMPA
jgi:hypothetical protein